MTDSILDPRVQAALERYGVSADVLPCDPDLADTAAFCEHYGFAMEQAANTILVASKKVDPPRYAVCVVLGTTRLDVNRRVSGLLGVKRLSFADAEVTRALSRIHVWPLDLAVCRAIRTLDVHGDPADEIIAATSVVHRAPLVTRDRALRRSKVVPLAA